MDSSFEPVRLSASTSSGTAVGILNNTGLAIQPDGKVIFGGAFSHVNGTARPGVARLNEDGTLDSAFVPSGFDVSTSPGSQTKRPVYSVAIRPTDGKVMIAGTFNPVRSGWTGRSRTS